jgi:hypothetical protein
LGPVTGTGVTGTAIFRTVIAALRAVTEPIAAHRDPTVADGFADAFTRHAHVVGGAAIHVVAWGGAVDIDAAFAFFAGPVGAGVAVIALDRLTDAVALGASSIL